MNINVSFAELREYIHNHYHKLLGFSKLSEKELRVAYEQHILFRTVQVPVKIRIEEVNADSVSVSYEGNFGIDSIITGVLTFFKAKVPELSELLITESGHKLRIELSKLDKTKALVEVVTFEDINITEDGLCLSVKLK